MSIVNWIKDPTTMPKTIVLDGQAVSEITSALTTAGLDVAEARRLTPNRNRSFQGPQPVGAGFILNREEAEAILALPNVSYRDVIRPYLVGDDILNDPTQSPRRFIIDFGSRSLEEAMSYPVALDVVRTRVKPFRDRNRRRVRREKWWLLGELVPAMRAALAPLQRYIGGTATGKRIVFCWCDRWVCPSNAMNAFALQSDYALGILSSRIHVDWARAQSSTLEDRIRYTPTSAFETFPWPQADSEFREAVAAVSRDLIEHRREICLKRVIGLTQLYNEVEEGAHRELARLHHGLDEAVALAYAWPKSAADDPVASNERLLELNRRIVAGEVAYRPFDPPS